MSLLTPESRRYLEAFSAGVNAYIHSHSTSEMSLEYTMLALHGLHYTPEDWTPVDSLAWLKAMAWDLRGNMEDEITRAFASVGHSRRQVAQLFPPYPYARHRPILDQGAVVDGAYRQNATRAQSRWPARPGPSVDMLAALQDLDSGLRTLPQLIGHGAGVGSNSWVVDGRHSSTGAPLLANDPHLGISLPGVWYQMGLHCNRITAACPFDVTGFTFSGLPGVVIGHNQQVAWGFTNLGPDVSDLYLEKVTGTRYLYGGSWRPLKMRRESIRIFGQDKPFVFTVRETRHGPLLSDVSRQLTAVGTVAPAPPPAPARLPGYAVALEWTALMPGTTGNAIFEIDRATSWPEFRNAARDFAVPSQNLIYADRAGHIGYQAPGLIPIRKFGRSGDYPAEGWRPADDWTGRFIPFDALPSVLDPKDGFVVTANQAVTYPDYAYYLGDAWSEGYRSQRIVELLQRQGKVSPEDMSRIQLDTRNGFAPILVAHLLRIHLADASSSAGQRLLRSWDFMQPPDSAAAAYYNAVWNRLLALTFHDQLQRRVSGSCTVPLPGGTSRVKPCALRATVWPDGSDHWFEVMRHLLAQPRNPWWDDVRTKGYVETRDDILQKALVQAQDEMVRRQGGQPSDWRWGGLHRMTLKNQSLGHSGVAVIEWLFNRGGYELGGGQDAVDATGWTAAAGFHVDWAPSMRMVVSLRNFDDSTWVNLTGASGHAFSAHYVDQTDLWATGRTLPWAYSPKAVRRSSEQSLTLVPAKAG
jgi:penicillin amidase